MFLTTNQLIDLMLIKTSYNISKIDQQLSKLKNQIDSIENCKLKINSKNIIFGDGDINSHLMLIGEAPGKVEDEIGHSFQGDIGLLLEKMLSAIDIKIKRYIRPTQ